jgi:glycosyltransferase involved in cell wall biosynthesis
MRIGLNATCINGRPSGAKQRFEGLFGAFIDRLPDSKFIIYEPADWSGAPWFGGTANVEVVRTPLPSENQIKRFVRGLTYWPARLADDRLDLFETFNLPLVKAPHCPTLLTIHDARSVRPDQLPVQQWLSRMVFRHALKRANRVVAVSTATKIELLALDKKARISVIHNGIDAARFSATSDERAAEACSRLGIAPDFLLGVGHLEKRKNYPLLVNAVAKLRKSRPRLSLVIVGNDSGERNNIEAEIDRLGLVGQVRLLSGISDPDLASLYHACSAVVFPSLYEGFGIPLLEAMAAGRPLACSDLGVFREITADRGCYFQADDLDGMVKALALVLDDDLLRGRLIEHGTRRVLDFSFEALAAELEQLYRIVLDERQPSGGRP